VPNALDIQLIQLIITHVHFVQRTLIRTANTMLYNAISRILHGHCIMFA